jgi:hypothetical protein
MSAAARRFRPPLTVRSVLIIIGLLLIFGILRLLSGLGEPPSSTGFFTTKVVVVGVTGRTQPTPTDRRVIDAHADDVQAGAISIRPQLQGECAAAGWLTIGAGRRTTAGGLCSPTVTGTGTSARVDDWSRRLALARAHSGDARLGTLASVSPGCIQSVGPGAALAAANPDGTLDNYQTVAQLSADAYRLNCPLTIIDAGADSDKIISSFAGQQGVTLLVAGVGPTAGSHDRNLQLIYRVGTTLPGLMTSDTTRRDGIVTLADLTRTLIGFTLGDKPVPANLPIDGEPIQVISQPVSSAMISDHLTSIKNLSFVAPVGYAVGAILGIVLAALLAVFAVRRWWPGVRVTIGALSTYTGALMLTGSFPWQNQSDPAAALVITFLVWVIALTAGSLLLSRWWRIPIPIVAAGLTMATFSTDAALGAVMQPGSLLNSRPVVGGRWYGFGNATFAVYAAAVLTVAGYVAHRFIRAGHRLSAVISVLIIGGFAVICEGWPTMGADFGGVLTLTPVVLLMALAISGWRITWLRVVAVAVAAAIVGAGVALLDWSRGAGHRSHLGDFVQRVLSGDAWPVVIRKLVATGDSLISLYGIIGMLLGALIWMVILRRLRHAIPADLFTTYTVTAIAVLATSVLGTLVNDLGIAIFLSVTGPFAMTTVGLLYYRFRPYGWPAVIHGEQFTDHPTPGIGSETGHRTHPERSGNPAVRGGSRRR